MPAKPIDVTILLHTGEVLGKKRLTPQNQNWRLLGTRPRVTLFPSNWRVPHPYRDCDPYEGGWCLRLLESDPMPLKVTP